MFKSVIAVMVPNQNTSELGFTHTQITYVSHSDTTLFDMSKNHILLGAFSFVYNLKIQLS